MRNTILVDYIRDHVRDLVEANQGHLLSFLRKSRCLASHAVRSIIRSLPVRKHFYHRKVASRPIGTPQIGPT